MDTEAIKLDRYAKFRKIGQYEEFLVRGGKWQEARKARKEVEPPCNLYLLNHTERSMIPSRIRSLIADSTKLSSDPRLGIKHFFILTLVLLSMDVAAFYGSRIWNL